MATRTSDRRFYLGWGGVAVMLGLSVVGFFYTADAVNSAGVFFLGLGIVLTILGLTEPRSEAVVAFGVLLLVIGGVIAATMASISPVLIAGTILVAGGFAVMTFGLLRGD